VHVTSSARSYLADQLEQVSKPESCFRLRMEARERMSTTVAAPRTDDHLVKHGEEVVLAIESDLADKLADKTIDIEPAGDGRMALVIL